MRAYQLTSTDGIDALNAVELPMPTAGPGQVVVRLHAASLNYRDLLIATGRYGMASTRPNLIPLSDGAGEVVEVGPGVTNLRVGDRVAGIFHQNWIAGEATDAILGSALGGELDGVLCEYRAFDAQGLVRLPDHLSYEQAATLPCAAVTAWNSLFCHQPVQPGDTVLTLGTGGVSVFAIQFAHAAGARVIATSSSDEKLQRVRELGATDLINYKRTPEWDEEVLRLTDGRGVDHVVEVGGAGTMERSIRATRRGGHVGVIGVLTMGQINPILVLLKGLVLRGIFVGSREMFEAMNRAIAANQIQPVIDRTFGFDEVHAAYRHLESGSHVGKVVIKISD